MAGSKVERTRWSNQKSWLGAVTPFGGLMLLAAWATIATESCGRAERRRSYAQPR